MLADNYSWQSHSGTTPSRHLTGAATASQKNKTSSPREHAMLASWLGLSSEFVLDSSLVLGGDPCPPVFVSWGVSNATDFDSCPDVGLLEPHVLLVYHARPGTTFGGSKFGDTLGPKGFPAFQRLPHWRRAPSQSSHLTLVVMGTAQTITNTVNMTIFSFRLE